MIPNHAQFLAAIAAQQKVCVRFYSKPDSGVLDRVCAPMDYGPGENPDGLNRYWLWDYVGEPGAKAIGLVPQQILDVRILGEVFNASEFIIEPAIGTAAPLGVATPVPVVVGGGDKGPVL